MTMIASLSANGSNAMQAVNPDTDNTVSLAVSTSTNRTSAALSTSKSNLYRFMSDVDCFVNKGGSSINSTTSKMKIKANVADYFIVEKDEYVAAITSASSGTLLITPCVTA